MTYENKFAALLQAELEIVTYIGWVLFIMRSSSLRERSRSLGWNFFIGAVALADFLFDDLAFYRIDS
jgi:hypothetical protein